MENYLIKLLTSYYGIADAIKVTLILAVSSTTISSIIGIIAGIFLESKDFKLKKMLLRIIRTLMGTPPVVAGLLVYILFMRRGIFGRLEWLFTIKGMVVAQVIIITPIITSMVYSYSSKLGPKIRHFCKSIGGGKTEFRKLMLSEMRDEIYFAVLTGFNRSISEVGAVMLVGGNIKGATRTMTTTISLLKNQGIFTDGILLGLILLIMTFILQLFTDKLKRKDNENI